MRMFISTCVKTLNNNNNNNKKKKQNEIYNSTSRVYIYIYIYGARRRINFGKNVWYDDGRRLK